jgi:hypothetical protein
MELVSWLVYITFYLNILKRNDHCGDLGVDVSIILKCILKKSYVRVWATF